MSTTLGATIVCKAAVSWAPEQLSVEQIRVDPPQQGEVRVHVINSSLCHSDITHWKGKGSSTFPAIFGHEGAGIVESVGEGVEDIKPGDHVVSVFQPECKNCMLCSLPSTNICTLAFKELGCSVMLADGKTRFSSMDGRPIYNFLGCSTFTEYTVMHHSHVAKVDPSAPLDKVCLLSCGVPTGLGAAWNIAKVTEGATVVVFGLGTVGLAVAEGAKIAGAARVIGVDIQPKKFAIAREFGVTDFVNPKEHEKPVYQVIHELTNGGVDFSFECVGNPTLMVDALESCHAFGTFVIVGVSPTGQKISFDPNTLFFGRQIRSGSLGGFKSRTRMPGLVDKFLTKEIDLDHYITHNLPLSNISEGFGLLLDVECVKCVFSNEL